MVDRSIPSGASGELQRILDECLECLRRGERLNPRWYYARFPHLEEALRGHFRRMGLVEDPFSNSAQFLREAPPWDRPTGAQGRPPGPPPAAEESQPDPPDRDQERKLLLENILRSDTDSPGGRFGRKFRGAAILALTFAAGWAGLMLLTDPWRVRTPLAEEASRIEGLAALSALAAGWPAAREDLLLEGIDEADRAAREAERWEVRWLRYLMLAELGREDEARRYLESVPQEIREELTSPWDPVRSRSRASPSAASQALAALGEIISRRPERARARLGPEAPAGSTLLAEIARGAAFPAERGRASRRLLGSGERHARLLGAAWGAGIGLASALEALHQIPISGLAEARMLVELGEEDEFLKRAGPGRLDLGPLRMRVLAKRGDRAGALRLAGELIAASPDSFDLRLAAAELLREGGECERSRDHLLAATLLRPDSPEPMREWFRLALRCVDRPDLIAPCADLFLGRTAAEARARLAAAAGRDPDSERLLAGCGFGLPAEEEVRARAVSLLRRAAAGSSGSPALSFLLARALFAQGEWREAAKEFAAAAGEADPRDEPGIRLWQRAAARRAGTNSGGPPVVAAASPAGAGPSGAPGAVRAIAVHRDEPPAARTAARGSASARVAALLFAPAEPDPGEPGRIVESLAGRVDLEKTGLATLDDYARALEETGAWQTAAVVRGGLLDREPGVPGRRISAAWAASMTGDAALASALLDDAVNQTVGAFAAAWDDPLRHEPGEECMLRAFLAARGGDLDLAADWLGAAIRREPVDPRPWFLRGYFLRLAGSESDSRRDWDEVLALVGSPPPGLNPATGAAARDNPLLEAAALPFELALIGAARGDDGLARWYAGLGPARPRTLFGSFFRAAALAAAGEGAAAEAQALSYRVSGYPVEPWQRLDPWAGSIFETRGAGTLPAPAGR